MFQDLRPPYAVIEADPPWRFRTWSETNQRKSASRHYSLMTLDQIKALPVGDLAAKDCALCLWAINPMLPHAIEVMEAWGFRFKTVLLTWAKTTLRTDASWAPKYHQGLGYWTRANSEMCLLGVRGKPKRLARNVPQLIVSPRREHSRKPDDAYSRIERLLPGPRVSLFSRESRPGWDTWGLEREKFD